MTPYELIVKKRDGKELQKDEIDALILAYHKDELPDYQMSALLMAIFFQGMTFAETCHLTQAMLHSGKVLNLDGLSGPKIDKHSTGGVGDKVSLPLIGIVAALGVKVPMVAGRGLGHTGGTLDKLETIPGFSVDLSTSDFLSSLDSIGCALIGQTADIAPVDKKIYALRDVTGTVSSIPLITGSIMSKKLAEGADGYVLDIKTGCGALMPTKAQAIKLGESLIQTALLADVKAIGYLTNMEQPLGNKIGNWLEIEESMDILEGNGPADLLEITLIQAGTMLYMADLTDSVESGIIEARKVIDNGKAREKFIELVNNQGGDSSVLDNRESYRKAKYNIELKAPMTGTIQSLNALTFGLVNVMIGGGRQSKTDIINPVTGITLHHKVGSRIKADEPILTLHVDDEHLIQPASDRLADAIVISAEPCEPLPVVLGQFTKEGFSAELSLYDPNQVSK